MIQVVPDKESLSQALADRFVASARGAIASEEKFTVALSGGHTPEGGFRLLAQEPRCSQIDWAKVHIFWGDERNVAPTDPNSNECMARDAFLNSVPIPAGQIHGMYNGKSNEEAAQDYESLLHSYFGLASPTFDLLMLGVGPDGHTASLFPGKAGLDSERWVIPAETDEFAVKDRITLTAKPLVLAKQVVFAVEGRDKADIIQAIIENGFECPAGYIARNAPNAAWLFDSDAASKLR